MKVKINKSIPCGSIIAPPSKSMAHRLLICSGLSQGTSIVRGISFSEDVKATLDCLSALGATYKIEDNTVIINGINPAKSKGANLWCRESGSTLRFFIPICFMSGNEYTLNGSETLLKRPLSVYEDICREQNLCFENNSKNITLKGVISAGNYKVKGNISSQFISGLLFVLPLLDEDSTISISPPIESCSYINLTIAALSQFGVKVVWADERTLYIKGKQSYKAQDVSVEGDYSNAAFFAALNFLGGNVEIEGLSKDSLQIKESDRALSMAQELEKFGVSVKVEEDSVVVYPADFHFPSSPLYGHNDHRIVMALSVMLVISGGEICGAEAVAKSMPDFFEKLRDLGIEVNEYADY